MSGFKVLKPGVFTLVQDKGRFNYTHLGVTNSGFMDEYSALYLNKLLYNDMNTNMLEILFGKLKFESLGDTIIAVTGARCEFKINGKQKNTWQSFQIKKGDLVEIGKINQGLRVYLGVKGGFTLKKEFGSFSTTIKESLGGIKARALKKDDFLPFKEHIKVFHKRLKNNFIPKYEENLSLRVVLGYQYEHFEQKELDKFFSSKFEITPDFNRMACKLKGEVIKCNIDGIISEGLSFGAIQIPKDGQPIILLKERQTIGGYPKIGSVLPIDSFKLAQAKIGSFVKFQPIEIKKAQEKMKEFYRIFR